MPSSMPRWSRFVLVTKMSSPTNWILSPSLSVISFQPSQSSSAKPSSIEQMGYLSTQPAYFSTKAAASICLAVDGVGLLLGVVEFRGGRVQGDEDLLAGLVARLADGLDDQVQGLGVALQVGGEAALVADVGGQLLRPCNTFFRLWKTSQPQRMASLKDSKPKRHDHELLHVHVVVGVACRR